MPAFTTNLNLYLAGGGSLSIGGSDEVADIDRLNQNFQKIDDLAGTITDLMPVGAVTAFAGSSAPTGWLICDGTAVARSGYPDLYAALGTTYGTGDGVTTFNLPNLKGRMPAGADSTVPEFDTLGESGGSSKHTHSVEGSAYAQLSWESGGRVRMNRGSSPSFTADVMTVSSTLAPLTADSTGTANGVELIGNTGDGSSLPPYLVMNYIIKAS